MEKVLVVIDMQNDFVDGTLGTKEAVAIVPNVVKKIKEWDGPIIATRDTHGNDYLNTSEGKKLPVSHCIKDTEGWMINKEVENALAIKNTIYINKPTFGSTNLPGIIKLITKKNMSIEIIGLCTDICVVSNALFLKTHFPETQIAVDASCCAGVTPETHKAALTTMKMCQIEIIE